MQLHWHRRDLRITDNQGLAASAESESVLPVFVFDPARLEDVGAAYIDGLREAVGALQKRYRERGGELVVTVGDPRDEIPALAHEHDVDGVTWNEEYTKYATERDRTIELELTDAGIDVRRFHDAVHHAPGTITTNDGDPYAVYTYYWRKWQDRDKAAPIAPPEQGTIAAVDETPVPPQGEFGVDPPEADRQALNPAAAEARLETFCDGPIYDYEEKRDYPAAACTSRLSADLAVGTIGVRRVYAATEAAHEAAPTDDDQESVEEYQSQLAWREFYTQVLWANPTVETENYKQYEHPIEWRTDPEGLAAWKNGNTGYPIVDAGMRQLRQEAYMHNRVRMIVASFLTKDLLIDWREGYEWFKRQLIDHNVANNTGGWQWAASTGTDAQPYFRIFNPMTQGERYDPDAEYIKRYVPELQGVDPEVIHSWNECSLTQRRRAAPEYPDPIVDHGKRREQALAMFKRARGEDPEEN